MERLSRETILLALRSLSQELANAGERAELLVAGGAALVLLFNARESTKDVDAIVTSASATDAIFSAARRVADASSLPDDWLNDGVKGYLHGMSVGESILDTPSLSVRALAVPQLLAMKLSAWRDDIDISDARLLLQHLSGSRDDVFASVERFVVPGREMKARYAFDDLWEAAHGTA